MTAIDSEQLDALRRAAILTFDAHDNATTFVPAFRQLHPDERVLGAVGWRVLEERRDLARLGGATFIAWLAQAPNQAFDVGDLQRLLDLIGDAKGDIQIAPKGHLVWDHALETMMDKVGRDALLVQTAGLWPPLRQAVQFAQLRRGWIGLGDIDDEDESALADALVVGWTDALPFMRGWLATTATVETGRLLAGALGRVPWTRSEPLALAAPVASLEEATRIVLKLDAPELSSQAFDLLAFHREALFVRLHGTHMAWPQRAFGPNIGAWLVGPTGLLGPAGVVATAACIVAYQVFGLLPLPAFATIFLASAAITRAYFQRPLAPALTPAVDPSAGTGLRVLAAWYLEECRKRAATPRAGWTDVPRLPPGDHVGRHDTPPQQAETDLLAAFRAVEFGDVESRVLAFERLKAHGDAESALDDLLACSLNDPESAWRHFENTWLTARRISPTAFRRTWATRPLWPVTQNLVFGAYNGYDELTCAFRLDETGELVDVHDRVVTIPAYHTIGVAHVDDLKEQADLWNHVFADYELVARFEQLCDDHTALPIALADGARPTLEAHGWLSDDDGFVWRRPLWSLGLTVLIEVEPPFDEPAQSRECVALSLVEGLHFRPPTALHRVRPSVESVRLTDIWLADLRRRIGR